MEGQPAHSMTASDHDEDAGTEMASGEAAWGKAMGNRDGQEEEMYALEEVLEEDTADIHKAAEEATAAAEGGSHQTNPGVEEPSDGGTSIV